MIDFRKATIYGAIILSPFLLAACKTGQSTNINTQSNGTTGVQQQQTSDAELGATIEYSDNGFSPEEVKVKVGQRVDYKNSSSKAVQVNSDPHPVHTTFPILNLNFVAQGETKSIVFDKAGTYKYHNHLNASERGTIVVL